MKKRIRLSSSIRNLFFILVAALTATQMIVQVSIRSSEFRSRAETVRNDFVKERKDYLVRDVRNAIEFIKYQRSMTEGKSRDIIIGQVNEAFAMALNIYEQNRSLYPDSVIRKLIVDGLRQVRFNNGLGYFFITGLDGVEVLFADRPEMEGRNMLGWQDAGGKHVIRDMIEIAKVRGEGFYEYEWTKPGSEGNKHRKISYIKLFRPYGWIIGTGLYMEDVEAQIKKEIISYYNSLYKGRDDYIFIGQWDGLSIAGPSAGKNVIDTEDATGFRLVRALIEEARKGGGFVRYRMPGFANQSEREKISYVLGISEWQWYVGSGVYIDSIEKTIEEMLQSLKKELYIQLSVLLLLSLLEIAVFMAIIYRISLLLRRDSAMLIDSLVSAAVDNREINLDGIHFEELYQAAGNSNKILNDKISAQEKLKEERERITATLQFIGDGVITVDSTGIILLINPAAQKLTGCRGDEAYGRKLEECFAVKDIISRNRIKSSAELALEKGIPAKPEEPSLLTDTHGKEYEIEESSVPMLDHDGIVRGAVLVFRDVTEIRKNEEERLKYRKLESLGVLAGGIAHDFNNLLTGVFGNIELARMLMPEEGEARKILESACDAIQNASSLTRQLLTFARGGDPVKKTIDMGRLLEENARFVLRGSRIRLEMDIAPDLSHVEADPGQMNQVISNIVINALQAMPDGGMLQVSAVNELAPEGDYVKITIADNGIGIAPQHMEKIFDPYFSTKQRGSGLGLASAYSIIKKHKGKIHADSRLNEGTVFTIFLPADEKKPPEEDCAERDSVKMSKAHSRILVLEDESIVSEVLGKMIEKLGHIAVITTEGSETVKLYRDALEKGPGFDLVITDLTIPGGKGGVETAGEILELDPGARLLVSSGYATDPVMAEYCRYGFRGVVVKPYRFADLKAAVENALSDT